MLRSRAASRDIGAGDPSTSAKVATPPVATSDSAVPQTTPAPAAVVAPSPVTPAAPATVAAPATTSDAGVTPLIKVGETPLGNGMVATRGDSGVFVAFDTPEFRTRSSEKFERILRATLPQIYGASADSALAAVPFGKLIAQGDLLYGLPTRGLHLPARAGWHFEIFPEIRPGQDGPLVVRYRASVAKD
ncbi:MAG TPA: hypothetical protein VGM82_04045 [Gemmatimonadaceae bacterium]